VEEGASGAVHGAHDAAVERDEVALERLRIVALEVQQPPQRGGCRTRDTHPRGAYTSVLSAGEARYVAPPVRMPTAFCLVVMMAPFRFTILTVTFYHKSGAATGGGEQAAGNRQQKGYFSSRGTRS